MAICHFKATKHTSKLLDQQLNYMEELMLQGQKNVEITEKELSDLSMHITDEVLKQKVIKYISYSAIYLQGKY